MKSKLSLMPETAAMVLQSLPYRGSLIDRKALRLVWCPEPNDKSWKVVGSNLCLARIKNCPDANATEGWKRKNGLWSLIGKNPILFLVKKKAFVFLPRRFHSWSLSSSSSLSSPSSSLPSVVVLTRMMSRQKFFDVTLKRLRRDSGKKLSSAVIIFGCCKNAEFRWKKISLQFSPCLSMSREIETCRTVSLATTLEIEKSYKMLTQHGYCKWDHLGKWL